MSFVKYTLSTALGLNYAHEIFLCFECFAELQIKPLIQQAQNTLPGIIIFWWELPALQIHNH